MLFKMSKINAMPPKTPETKYSIEDIIYYKPGENFFDSIPFSFFD